MLRFARTLSAIGLAVGMLWSAAWLSAQLVDLPRRVQSRQRLLASGRPITEVRSSIEGRGTLENMMRRERNARCHDDDT